MPERKRYRRRADRPIVAVCLLLDTPGIDYRKWGADQHGKPGDWLIDNAGDVYTVDADSFAATYRPLGPGTFEKITPVWAVLADTAGSVTTREGRSHYDAGDYIVSNSYDGADSYAIDADSFLALYEPVD